MSDSDTPMPDYVEGKKDKDNDSDEEMPDQESDDSKGNMTPMNRRSSDLASILYPPNLINAILEEAKSGTLNSLDVVAAYQGVLPGHSTYYIQPDGCITFHPAPGGELAIVGWAEKHLLADAQQNPRGFFQNAAMGKIGVKRAEGVTSKPREEEDKTKQEMYVPGGIARDKLHTFMDGDDHIIYTWTISGIFSSNAFGPPQHHKGFDMYEVPFAGGVFRWGTSYEDKTPPKHQLQGASGSGAISDVHDALYWALGTNPKTEEPNTTQEGTMAMDWNWLEPNDNSHLGGLINIFSSFFENLKWTRTLAGMSNVHSTSKTTRTPPTGFSNIGQAAKFGRIYQMIAIFNYKPYWEPKTANNDYSNMCRVNYGFFIYHIMLTIVGYSDEKAAVNYPETLNHFWDIKQSTINNLFCRNIFDINFLTSQINGTIDCKYNKIMEALSTFFGPDRRIRLSPSFDTKLHPCSILTLIGHGMYVTKAYGPNLIAQLKGSQIMTSVKIDNNKVDICQNHGVEPLQYKEPLTTGKGATMMSTESDSNSQNIMIISLTCSPFPAVVDKDKSASFAYLEKQQLMRQYEYRYQAGQIDNHLQEILLQSSHKKTAITLASDKQYRWLRTGHGQGQQHFTTHGEDFIWRKTQPSTRALLKGTNDKMSRSRNEVTPNTRRGIVKKFLESKKESDWTKLINFLKKEFGQNSDAVSILMDRRHGVWRIARLKKLAKMYDLTDVTNALEEAGEMEGGGRRKTKKRRKKKKKKKTKKTKRVKRKKTRRKKRRKSRKNKLK